jgi:hypothetical protein
LILDFAMLDLVKPLRTNFATLLQIHTGPANIAYMADKVRDLAGALRISDALRVCHRVGTAPSDSIGQVLPNCTKTGDELEGIMGAMGGSVCTALLHGHDPLHCLEETLCQVLDIHNALTEAGHLSPYSLKLMCLS